MCKFMIIKIVLFVLLSKQVVLINAMKILIDIEIIYVFVPDFTLL